MKQKSAFIHMMKYLSPYKGKVVISLIGTLLSVFTTLAYPYLVNYGMSFISADSIKEVTRPLILFGVLSIGTWFIDMLSAFIRYKIMDRVLNRVDKDLREKLFDKCLHLSYSYYDNHRIGTLISTISQDVTAVREILYLTITEGLEMVLQLVLIIIVFSNLALPLVAIILPLTIIEIYVLYRSGKYLYHVKKEKRRAESTLIEFIEDRLSGIRTVIGFGTEKTEMGAYCQMTEEVCQAENKKFDGHMRMQIARSTYANALYDAVLLGGVIMTITKMINISSLVAVYSSIYVVTEAVYSLIPIIRSYQESAASFERIADILNTTPDIREGKYAINVSSPIHHIEFEDVSFKYNSDSNDSVLSKLDFEINVGEYIAIVGESGEGKSTLSKLIPRYYDVTDGRILIDGGDIRGYKLGSLRRNIGVVDQSVYLFADTILENIRFGKPSATLEEVKHAAVIANADKFISELPNGYDSFVGERGVKLSGGQRQRIAIARCVLAGTPIMIFDEATSSLDVNSEREIQSAIEKVAKERTVIVIAHRLSTIINADRILVMKGGNIVESGSHEELIKMGGVYADLYKTSED